MSQRNRGRARLATFLVLLGSLFVPVVLSAQRAELEKIIKRKVLSNGLEVIVVENHGVPLATIEVNVKNGSFTQSPEYAGLAHMYEHMFFRANDRYSEPESFVGRAGDLGAVFNGTTSEERVNYYLTVSSDSLVGGIRFLASALLAPLFRQEELERERQVVIGEYDRNESSPFFRLNREMDKLLYPGNFSRKNIIGDRQVILTTTPEKMRAIQRKYYVPNNSVLIVSGDVDPQRVFAVAERELGTWQRGEDPFVADPVPAIPALTKSEGLVVEADVGAVTVFLQWQGPSVGKDPRSTFAADVFSDVLNDPGSNFQQRLVDSGLWQSMGVNYYTLDNVGPITISGQTSPENLRKALTAVGAEVRRFDDPGYFDPGELAAVKAHRAVTSAFDRERASGFAHTLGFWWSVADLEYYMGYVDNMANQTIADLRAYAAKYIIAKPRITGVLINPAARKQIGLTTEELARGGDKLMLLSIALALTTLTTSFDVGGIRVILRQSDANNVVAANLYLLGGSRQVTAANAGIESLLLEVSDRGTKKYPRAALRRKMSLLGSEIATAPSDDWTMFGIRATREVFDSTWAIFADRVMQPTLNPEDVALIKSQFLSGIRQRRDDPDALAEYLADSIAFVGHPYGTPVTGTEASISSLDAKALRDYHSSQFVKSRMLLVVVGNVDRAHVERLVRGTLTNLPLGNYAWTPPPRLPEGGSALVVEQRDLPTNYIVGYYSGPLANSEDYQALRIATSILTGRMFSEIRTRQNLTYDVHAPFLDRAASAGGLYVSTAAPDTTLKLMYSAVRELQEGLLDPTGLERLEQQFLTEYFLDNETNDAQASFLARAQLYRGDYRAADRFVEELKSVTPEAVRRVARRYMKGMRFAYVGDPRRLRRDLITRF